MIDTNEDGIIAFDNLMLSDLKRCPRYFQHRHVEHLVPTGESFDTDFKAQYGVAFHNSMDIWFDSSIPEEDRISLMDKAFIDTYLPFEGMDRTNLRTIENGLRVLSDYRKKYPVEHDPFSIKPDRIEVGFACELGSYVYCGRIDKIATWKIGFEGTIVLDHKTSASKGYLHIKPNAAIDGYIWGASQMIKETVIGGYFDQVYLYKVKPTKFIRELTERCNEEIEEWKREAISWMDLANKYLSDNFFPRSTGHCFSYGKDCEYKMLCCCKNEEQKIPIKENMYEEHIWKPYKEEGDKI